MFIFNIYFCWGIADAMILYKVSDVQHSDLQFLKVMFYGYYKILAIFSVIYSK